MTPSQFLWSISGQPPCDIEPEPYSGPCSTCGHHDICGVKTDDINNPGFSQHDEYFRFGSHVCRACAWLYRMGKSNPGNIIGVGQKIYRPTIAENEGRDRWIRVLEEISQLPSDTYVAGVLTTDVKPRVWPRMRMATIGQFGLVVHAPDYDVAGYISMKLPTLLSMTTAMASMLARGYSKRSLLVGILKDFPRASKHLKEAMDWEYQLSIWRPQAEFAAALVVAAAPEKPVDHGNDNGRPTTRVEPATTASRKSIEKQPGLFQ